MNHLNDENIDEIMFQLLEGEIQGEERTHLLEAINADKKYAAIWATWQKTVLNSNDELLVMNTNKLKKNIKSPVLLWVKYAAAACVFIAFGYIFWSSSNNNNLENFADKNGHKIPKTNIIKVPENENKKQNILIKDTVKFIPLKDQIKYMADEENNLKTEFKSPKIIEHKQNENQINELVNLPPINKIAENKEPLKIENKIKQEEKTIEKPKIAQINEDDNTIITYETESVKSKKTNSIQNKVNEKTNLLARIFSKPKLQIVNDSNTYTRKKLIIQNKEYKIIAGF